MANCYLCCLEQRQYKNDLLWLKTNLVLKLPRFFIHRAGERKIAAFSKLNSLLIKGGCCLLKPLRSFYAMLSAFFSKLKLVIHQVKLGLQTTYSTKKIAKIKLISRVPLFLEQREYQNDSIQSKIILVLKLLPFFVTVQVVKKSGNSKLGIFFD